MGRQVQLGNNRKLCNRSAFAALSDVPSASVSFESNEVQIFMFTEKLVSEPYRTLYCHEPLKIYRKNSEIFLHILGKVNAQNYTKTNFSIFTFKILRSINAKSFTAWHTVGFLALIERQMLKQTIKIGFCLIFSSKYCTIFVKSLKHFNCKFSMG